MVGLALLLSAAAAAFAAAKALRLPPLPLLLAAGLLLGRLAELPELLLENALILGIAFLLFVAGIELSPGRTRGQRNAAIRVGLLQFLLLGLAGLGGALALGFDRLSALYLALALAASSTLVGVRLLRQRRQMFEPFGRLVTGVLLVQDVLAILLIPLVTRSPDGLGAVVGGLVAVLALLVLAAAAWRWGTPRIAALDGDEETLLLATLALLFAFAGLAAWLDLPLLVGAFLAGVALSGFPARSIVRPQVASVGDFFSAIFFTALGALVGVPSAGAVVQALMLALLVVVLTPPLVTVIAEWSGLPARSAIEAGLLLAQTSEISLVIVLHGMLEGHVAPEVFSVIAMVTLLTMILTPFMATDRAAWSLMHLHPVRQRQWRRTADVPRDHVLVLGSGTTGLPLLETLLGTDHDVMVVDDDPDVVARLRAAEVPVIRGDASDIQVLDRAGARNARVIASTIRRPEDNRRLLEFARSVPVVVRVFEEADAEWIRALGGIPVLYSEAAAEGLVAWIDRELGPPPAPSDSAAWPRSGEVTPT
jgi:Kef-type K+ transport system membrane component KefB